MILTKYSKSGDLQTERRRESPQTLDDRILTGVRSKITKIKSLEMPQITMELAEKLVLAKGALRLPDEVIDTSRTLLRYWLMSNQPILHVDSIPRLTDELSGKIMVSGAIYFAGYVESKYRRQDEIGNAFEINGRCVSIGNVTIQKSLGYHFKFR